MTEYVSLLLNDEYSLPLNDEYCECEELVKLLEITNNKESQIEIMKLICQNYNLNNKNQNLRRSYGDIIITKIINSFYNNKMHEFWFNYVQYNYYSYSNKITIEIDDIDLRFRFDKECNLYRVYDYSNNSCNVLIDKKIYDSILNIINLNLQNKN